ncbi:hypothetical protein H5T87_04420 [bacterium]|nr:hypothetical protein [bacterium]
MKKLMLLSILLIYSFSFSTNLLELIAQKGENIKIDDFLALLSNEPTSLLFGWRENGADWHLLRFTTIKGTKLYAEDSYFSLELSPQLKKGGLSINCKIIPKRDLEGEHELLLTAPFEPSHWDRQFYPRLPYLVLPPDSPATIRFLAKENDWTELQELGVYFYPFGILENRNHFILWGSLDIGKFALLTPNLIPNHIPAICLRPLKISRTQPLSFELFLKSFPKSKFPKYRDVLRWYIQNWEDSDPLTSSKLSKARAILEAKTKNPRRLPWGNLAGFPGGEPIADEQGKLNEWGKHLLMGWKSQKIGSCWYYAWHGWDETYPTEGEWIGEVGFKNSAEKIRGYIRALLNVGVHPFLYFRQFVAKEGLKEDEPPYKDWAAINERGQVPWGYEWAPSKENAQLIGYDRIHCLPADFGNDSFRLWYLENLKRCIDYYEPAGIAFDMGWAYPSSAVFSRANPNSSNPHAVVRLQADVYEWLAKKHPQMRIITNEAPGVPSQLFSDGILIEGGFAVGKSELDYEAAKAIPTTVISFEYPSQYANLLQPLDKNERPYLIIKYRAEGLAISDDYAIHITENIPGREGTAISLRQLNADSNWHIATVDLRPLTQVEKIKGFAIQVQSASEKAYIDIAYICFSPSPEISEPAPQTFPFNTFPSYIDSRFISFYQSHPEWLQNPATNFSLRREGDFLRFEVIGKGQGMKWGFLAHRGLIAQEYMKVLSLGACIGGDLWYPFKEILSFSAEAMSVPPITDSHRITLPDDRIWASGWEDEKELLLAIYNNSEEFVKSSLKLTGDVEKKLAKCKAVMLNKLGEPIEQLSIQIKGKEVKFELPPKSAILLAPKEVWK